MKSFISKFGGVIAGVVYGLLMRTFFFSPDMHANFGFSDLFSVTFIWIVPLVIGIIPIIFSSREQLGHNRYRWGMPLLTVLLFFTICTITRIEDLICILVISFPFCVGAAVVGIFFTKFVLYYRDKKGILYSVFLLPIVCGLIEPQIPAEVKSFEIKTAVVINAKPKDVWANIVRVRQIDDKEYHKGFFNYAGIPRPLYAELDKDTLGATRTGHFEGGLIFKETVNYWERNKKVSFDIQVITSTIRQTVFDQHVLKGDHFKFLNAAYELKQISPTQTELTLTSSYRLDTHINLYGSYWGNSMLNDFQERLLAVIKSRCDKKTSSISPHPSSIN